MATTEQQAAREALSRLGNPTALAIQIAALMSLGRALLATHPDKDAVRAVYDQFMGQLMAQPGIVDDPDQMTVLRDLTNTIFQPSVQLDIGD